VNTNVWTALPDDRRAAERIAARLIPSAHRWFVVATAESPDEVDGFVADLEALGCEVRTEVHQGAPRPRVETVEVTPERVEQMRARFRADWPAPDAVEPAWPTTERVKVIRAPAPQIRVIARYVGPAGPFADSASRKLSRRK
jgi:hypothetical protein